MGATLMCLRGENGSHFNMSNCEGQMGATLMCLIVRDKWEPL